MKRIFLLVLFVCGVSLAETIVNKSDDPSVIIGDFAKGSTVSSAQTAIQTDLTAIQTDLQTLGDVTNSYITVDGNVIAYHATSNSSPWYTTGDYALFKTISGWRLSTNRTPNSVLTNSSASYYPPMDGWYHASTGLATNLNIKFFSGTDALQQAQIDNMIPAYGEIYIHDGTATTNIATTSNYFRIAGFTNGISSNVTCTSSALVVQVAGTYKIAGQLSFLGQQEKSYEVAVFINGIEQAIGEAQIGTAATVVPMSCSFGGVLKLAVGDMISMRVQSTGTGNITPTQASLSAVRISPVSTVDGVNYALKDGSNITNPAAFRTAIGAVGSTNGVLYFTASDNANVLAGLRFSSASNQFYFVAVTNTP